MHLSGIMFLKFLTISTDWKSPSNNRNYEFLCSKLSNSLNWCLIDVRSIKTGKLSVFRFLSNQSFHASFVKGFTCIALFSLFILHFCNHISHSLVSHTTRIHFAKLGTQLDLKIDWLLLLLFFFLSVIHFSTCYFFTCVNY